MSELLLKVKHVLTGWVGQTLWHALGPEWTLPSGLAVQVKTQAEWVIYNDIFVNREYDDAILDTVNSNINEPLIVDLGANVGYFGLRFADLWIQGRGRQPNFDVVGVEGSPAIFEELTKRIRGNPTNDAVLAGRLRYHFGLVGEKTGQTFISTSFFHVTNSIAGERSRFGSMVSFVDLETLLPGERRISLLKCDIEGAEELFLTTYPSLLKRVDQVVIELHPRRCNVERCAEMLFAAGMIRHSRVRDSAPEFTVDRFMRP